MPFSRKKWQSVNPVIGVVTPGLLAVATDCRILKNSESRGGRTGRERDNRLDLDRDRVVRDHLLQLG